MHLLTIMDHGIGGIFHNSPKGVYAYLKRCSQPQGSVFSPMRQSHFSRYPEKWWGGFLSAPPLREARGSPKDPVTGRPFFWFLFFGGAKKREKEISPRINRTSSGPPPVKGIDQNQEFTTIHWSLLSREPGNGENGRTRAQDFKGVGHCQSTPFRLAGPDLEPNLLSPFGGWGRDLMPARYPPCTTLVQNLLKKAGISRIVKDFRGQISLVMPVQDRGPR